MTRAPTSERDFTRVKVVGKVSIGPKTAEKFSKRQISTGCLRLMAAKKKKSGLRGSPFGTVPEVMSVKESLLVAEASAALDHPLLAR